MAIDAEPKNGDFARYIEELTSAGGASPGRIASRRDARRQTSPVTVPIPVAAPPSPTPGSLSEAPWANTASSAPRSRSASQAPLATAPGQPDEANITLARQAGRRKLGVVLTVAGIMAGWAAANIAFRALQSPRFELDELMPAIFLAFFAFMLFKAARGARNPRKTPLNKLPPLTPSSYRKDGA
ncbi:hypothetical protein [Achromobacter mucicolens]|uniref:Protein TonB n=1 Tax=Achromobacter mucicolens TaxID=1389922 RepID=A0ABM8LBQ0_9BURK|nr:hypothetical protein [Achromobacter mucicolens]CAB3852139.1 hypothetical protein LMG3415_01988 [Achromobacter mucicolens]